MSGPKTRPTDVPAAALFADQAAGRRADCEALVRMMQAATGEPPVAWGDAIVGFGRYASQSGGKPAEWPVVGFSPRKRELALYLMQDLDAQAPLLAALGPHRAGKSCLYLKRLADVDAAVLRRLVDAAVAAMAPRRIGG